MNIAVSQDLARSRGVSEVSSRTQTKAAGNQQAGAIASVPAVAAGTGMLSSAAVLSQLDDELARQSRTAYDQPQPQQQKALAAYQQLEMLSKREQIKQTFGVDLFA